MRSISKPQVESYDNISYDLHTCDRKWTLKGMSNKHSRHEQYEKKYSQHENSKKKIQHV